MSSTNRGSDRSTDDYYSSPSWGVDALLRRLPPLAGKRILEPSAGTGGIVRRLLAAGATKIVAIEPDPDRAASIQHAPEVLVRMAERRPYVIATRLEAWAHGAQRFDLVVMNPPFSLALEHVEKAISLLAPGGLCAALLRVAFACSQKRAPFRARHPFDMFLLAQRPGFATEKRIGGSTASQQALFGDEPVEAPEPGQTDSADYAWFLFGHRPIKDLRGEWTLSMPTGGHFEVIEEGPST